MTLVAARARAIAAIDGAKIDDASPFAATEALAKTGLGLSPGDELARLRFWHSRVPGSRVGDDRYRWELSHRRCKGGSHVPPREQWKRLRPDTESDPEQAETRLSIPLAVADGCEYLSELAERPGEIGELARPLLVEALPLFRRDLASFVQPSNPWTDTFALRCAAVRPRALEHLRPLALAIAASYAPLAEGGVVLGWRYPLHERPMLSATAHLITGLAALGHDIPLLGKLLSTLRAGQHANGGFGDAVPEQTADKLGRDDALTTFAATEALASLDPSFDPGPALAWLVAAQRSDGFIMQFGPDLLWLTASVVGLIDAAGRPFAERFRFPQVPSANLDRKTGLPFYAYYDDLSVLFRELPGLAANLTSIAFIDLAGFGAFNNAFGQDLGDDVLAAFASELGRIPFARAIRDGGDEFIVVGAPGRPNLARTLDDLRRAWPARFRERFGQGVPPVAPRILVTSAAGRDLRTAREELGRGMGSVKASAKNLPPEGVLEQLGR